MQRVCALFFSHHTPPPPHSYTALLPCLNAVPLPELVMAIRRQSQGFTRGSTSYRGVTLHRADGGGGGGGGGDGAPAPTDTTSSSTPARYEVRVGLKGGRHAYLGLHASETDAARVYDRAAVHLSGGGAATNFPLNEYASELASYAARAAGEAPPLPTGPALEDWLWAAAVPAGSAANRRSVRGPRAAAAVTAAGGGGGLAPPPPPPPPSSVMGAPTPPPKRRRSGVRRPAGAPPPPPRAPSASPPSKRRASGRRPAKADTVAASTLAELAAAVSPPPVIPRRPARAATPEGVAEAAPPPPPLTTLQTIDRLALWLGLVVAVGTVADAMIRLAKEKVDVE